MDTIKDKVKLKKNGNKYRHKKRKFYGNRYTKKNCYSPIDIAIHKTDSQVDSRPSESTSSATTTTTTSTSITISTQERAAPNAVAPSSLLPVSIPTPVKKKQITRKRTNVSSGPLQVHITSLSGDNVVQQPTPKRTKPTAKKVSDTQDVARSILTSIIKNKKQCVPNLSSTNQRQSAQISRANNGRPRASIQTDKLTSFHCNVHKLMILMTDTDPGNVEDIEEVVASVLEQHGQLEA